MTILYSDVLYKERDLVEITHSTPDFKIIFSYRVYEILETASGYGSFKYLVALEVIEEKRT